MKISHSEEQDLYYCDLTLKSLEDFGKINNSKALIRIDFHTLFERPTNQQKNALNYLIENEVDVFKNMTYGIIEAYNKEILVKFEKFKEFLPVIQNQTDLYNEISITDIIISGNSQSDFAFIMFKGECSWDTEHGFSTVMHRNEFIKLDSWDHYY